MCKINETGKMARLTPRDTIVGTQEDLERAQKELDDGTRSVWEDAAAPKP